MILLTSMLIFLIRHILLNVCFYLNLMKNCQVNFYSVCILEGGNGLLQNALSNINYAVFWYEQKRAFLCFK